MMFERNGYFGVDKFKSLSSEEEAVNLSEFSSSPPHVFCLYDLLSDVTLSLSLSYRATSASFARELISIRFMSLFTLISRREAVKVLV